ncbi:MAG TPA: S53 family peptidase [Puia sp.]|jgi:kumamolisin|nr:S53 family peptidase [Puia sp.]
MPTAENSGQPNLPEHYVPLSHSEHLHPPGHEPLGIADAGETITATLILRRNPGGEPMKGLDYFQHTPLSGIRHVAHKDFAATHGANPAELRMVVDFAHAHHLEVRNANAARRSVVVRGTADQINKAFSIQLHHYRSPLGNYHGHEGHPSLPADISKFVELIVGLDNRPVPAKHYATTDIPHPADANIPHPVDADMPHPADIAATKPAPVASDPPNTVPLTPQQVAKLYNFPAGNGAGQTIGIYEMPTSDGAPGYSPTDVAATIKAFGGGLQAPTPVDVNIDGQANTGQTDPETLLDITVSSAIAQGAKTVVYFAAGQSTLNIINALQRMIHPDAATDDPEPTVLSISYGWSPDEDTDSITAEEYQQMSQLFQDAAHLGITVLVSSGDSGCEIASQTKAEASYPASDPWVTACGGTTIGDVNGDYTKFTEYVWNDSWGQGQEKQSGATGGGVSERFPLPSYQNGFPIPLSLDQKKSGRGLPDLAGPASPVCGYPQVQGGQEGNGGGTSAVAPLYAGLIAIINANLGAPVGFLNPQLYAMANTAFREISGPPGPANNSFGRITGYPASKVWNACTGLGSIDGTALQTGLKTAATGTASPAQQTPVTPNGIRPSRLATPDTSSRPSRLATAEAQPEATADYSKKEFNPVITNHPDLPAIDWGSIGASAPQLPATPADDLPAADAVVICWADAEWAPIQHVFCDSANSMSYSDRTRGEWPRWQKYTEGLPSGVNSEWTYWGYYRLVLVGAKRVLLFKSNTHIDFPGEQYLEQIIGILIDKVNPSLILSTGTAGGTIPANHVGTINVVDAGTLYDKNTPQSGWQTYASSWKAGWDIVSKPAFVKLLVPVPTTGADVSSIADQFNKFYNTSYPLSELDPGNLSVADAEPALNNMTTAGTSLLTASSFVVGNTNGNLEAFACVEMDDAVIDMTCKKANIAFGSVRNISDPAQNSALPSNAQGDWGSAIYNAYGFYTSYNGAIVAWAVLNA